MSIPRIIHQIWIGDVLPAHLMASIFGVRKMHIGPDWNHILWNEKMLGAIGIDVQELRRQYGSWASVSNVARLMVLRQFGGVYLDCDFICHKPMDSLIQNGTAVAAKQDEPRVCNAFMAAEPGHPWIERQFNAIGNWKGHGAEWGVSLATLKMGDDVTLVPRNLVYPYLWDDPPEKRIPHSDTVIEHLWEKMWQ